MTDYKLGLHDLLILTNGDKPQAKISTDRGNGVIIRVATVSQPGKSQCGISPAAKIGIKGIS
jgi:hypothetical protein